MSEPDDDSARVIEDFEQAMRRLATDPGITPKEAEEVKARLLELGMELVDDPAEAGFDVPPGPVTVSYFRYADAREEVVRRAVEKYRRRQENDPPIEST